MPENSNRKLQNMGELGQTGLNRMGGLVYEEFLKELSYSRRTKIYKEMSSNDPVIGAILFAIDMLIRRVSWRVQAVSDDSADQEAADFLYSCLHDMSQSWPDTISEIMSMLVFGYSPHEIVYKYRQGESRDPARRSRYTDGRIGWRKLPIRAQETLHQWTFDDDGGLRGMVQQPPPNYQLYEIPIEKMLLFRTSVHKGNPEGKSVLRTAYRPWYFKKHIEQIEGIGIERDLAGLPVAYVPPEILDPNAASDQKTILNNIKKIVTNIRRDEQEGIVFPLIYDENGNKMYDLQLLSTGGRRQFDTNAIIARYDQRIAMSVLADFILLGSQKVGSFALASSKTELFASALGTWLDVISEVMNRFAVDRLFGLNAFSIQELPTLEHGDVESVDLAELGDYISKLAGAGMPLFPDTDLENYLRQQASLPEVPEE